MTGACHPHVPATALDMARAAHHARLLLTSAVDMTTMTRLDYSSLTTMGNGKITRTTVTTTVIPATTIVAAATTTTI